MYYNVACCAWLHLLGDEVARAESRFPDSSPSRHGALPGPKDGCFISNDPRRPFLLRKHTSEPCKDSAIREPEGSVGPDIGLV